MESKESEKERAESKMERTESEMEREESEETKNWKLVTPFWKERKGKCGNNGKSGKTTQTFSDHNNTARPSFFFKIETRLRVGPKPYLELCSYEFIPTL